MMQLTQTQQQTQKVQHADHHLRSSLHCSSPSRPARVELLVHLLCKHLIIYAIFIIIIITIHISNLRTKKTVNCHKLCMKLHTRLPTRLHTRLLSTS